MPDRQEGHRPTVVLRYGGKERTTCCDVAPAPDTDPEGFRRCSRCRHPLSEPRAEDVVSRDLDSDRPNPSCDASDLHSVERAVVYTPQDGDVIVLEVPLDVFSPQQAEQLKRQAEDVFGRDVKIAVLGGVHFAGVVRDE